MFVLFHGLVIFLQNKDHKIPTHFLQILVPSHSSRLSSTIPILLTSGVSIIRPSRSKGANGPLTLTFSAWAPPSFWGMYIISFVIVRYRNRFEPSSTWPWFASASPRWAAPRVGPLPVCPWPFHRSWAELGVLDTDNTLCPCKFQRWLTWPTQPGLSGKLQQKNRVAFGQY